MITKEQLLKRKHYLGASDVSIIVNQNPWETSSTLKLSKIYEHIDLDSVVVEMGNRYESVILQGFAERMGVELTGGSLEYITEDDLFCIHPDDEFEQEGVLVGVEAKKTDLWENWGEDEFTDQLPEHIVIQTQMQMHGAGYPRVYVVVLLPWYGRLTERIYLVERDQALIDYLVEASRAWWQKHIVEGLGTPVEVPNQPSIIKRLERVPNSFVSLDPELYNRYEKMKVVFKLAKEEFGLAESALQIALEDSEGGELPDGSMVTFAAGKPRTTVDSPRLRVAHPGIWDQFSKKGRPPRGIKFISAEARNRSAGQHCS